MNKQLWLVLNTAHISLSQSPSNTHTYAHTYTHQVLGRSIEAQENEALLKSFIELGDHCPKFLRSQLENILELMLKVCMHDSSSLTTSYILLHVCTGDADRVTDGLLETAGTRADGYHSRERPCHDEKTLRLLSTDRWVWPYRGYVVITCIYMYVPIYVPFKNLAGVLLWIRDFPSRPHTVSQGLQFMLQVEDDEEWLAADSADDDEDNTRYAACCLYRDSHFVA